MSKKTTEIIFKILELLEEAMDHDNFDFESISSEALGISENRRIAVLEIMVDEGLMKGLSILRGAQGDYTVSIKGPRITLAGLSYLSENSTTSKVINAAKFLKDVIPGL